MEKKRSTGISVFAIAYALLGIYFLMLSPLMIRLSKIHKTVFETNIPQYSGSIIFTIIAGVVFLASAYLMFKLYPLGWQLAIIALVLGFIAIDEFRPVAVVLFIGHCYFFTRPKVKEQFKK